MSDARFSTWGPSAWLAKRFAHQADSWQKAGQVDARLAQKIKTLRERNEKQALQDQFHDVYLMRLQPPAGYLRFGLLAVAITLGVLVLWAALSPLDEVTRGVGKVVPTSREQVVQAFEAGVVAEVMVKEGQLVEEGEPLVRIDDVRLGANVQESQARINSLRVAAIRLKAESLGLVPDFPEELVLSNPRLVATEKETFRTRRSSLDTSIAGLNQMLKVAEDEMKITGPLAAKGLVSDIEVLRIQRTISEANNKIRELRAQYRAESAAELARTEGELGSQRATLVGRKDAFKRTILRAPKRGVVKNIRVTTLGGVVQGGQEIMEIVPTDDTLLIEARIRPSDIAFLRPGMQAIVKVTAYDSGIYGWLDGELLQISPDTLRDEVRRDETYYKAIVRTTSSELKTKEGKILPIIAGMQAVVDIKTGQKSVLSYLFKPVLRAREALRER